MLKELLLVCDDSLGSQSLGISPEGNEICGGGAKRTLCGVRSIANVMNLKVDLE